MSSTQHSNSSNESFASAQSHGTAVSSAGSYRTIDYTYSILEFPNFEPYPINEIANYPSERDLLHRIAAARAAFSPEDWSDVHLLDAIIATHRTNNTRHNDLTDLFPWERRLLRFDEQHEVLRPRHVFMATRSLAMGLHRHAQMDRTRISNALSQ